MATNYNPLTMNIAAVDNFSDMMLKVSISDFISETLDNKLEIINQRLAILETPTEEKLQKYAALKKAYDHYKMVEKLLNDE
jgi:hypothetical protein